MTDDREPFREAREHGLKARHEQRLENATYTAAEVKVLTEAALRLGRAEMAEELAKAFEQGRPLYNVPVFSRQPDRMTAARMVRLYARNLGSQASQDATSARTDPMVDPEPPRDPGSASRPPGGGGA